MRAAIGVRAQLLEQRDAVFLDGVGHGRAHAGVILMIAEAAHLDVLAVEEEALVRVVADRAQARLHALEMLAEIAAHARLDAVEVRRIDRPQLGLFDGDRALHDRAVIALHRSGLYSRAAQAAGGRVERGFEREITVVFKAVFDGRLDLDRPAAFLKDRLGPDAVVRDVRGGLLVQPDAAIDARALVPPALMLLRVDIHRHDILLSEARHVGDIHLEGGIAAGVVLHPAAVDIHSAMHRHALEEQHDALALTGRVQREMLAVPRVVILEIAQRVVVLHVRRLRNDVIVRQRDLLPCFRRGARSAVGIHAVGIGHGSRADEMALRLGLSVDQPLAARRLYEYIALVKQPVPIEIEPFSHDSILPARFYRWPHYSTGAPRESIHFSLENIHFSCNIHLTIK